MDKCCGGIIFKKYSQILYLLVKHQEKDGGHWNFPKGHVEEGETEEQTATREIYEEVGLKVSILNNFRESNSYFDHINHKDKTVIFFLCEAITTEVQYNCDEIADHQWLPFEKALDQITHDDAKKVLVKADLFLKNL
ncbi:NUDIX domain-containing protein [Candidatus Woesearchaeota archaeon]|nr:NUDIX domain-containing protein [Candidatus Woesearchaeota archaeon]